MAALAGVHPTGRRLLSLAVAAFLAIGFAGGSVRAAPPAASCPAAPQSQELTFSDGFDAHVTTFLDRDCSGDFGVDCEANFSHPSDLPDRMVRVQSAAFLIGSALYKFVVHGAYPTEATLPVTVPVEDTFGLDYAKTTARVFVEQAADYDLGIAPASWYGISGSVKFSAAGGSLDVQLHGSYQDIEDVHLRGTWTDLCGPLVPPSSPRPDAAPSPTPEPTAATPVPTASVSATAILGATVTARPGNAGAVTVGEGSGALVGVAVPIVAALLALGAVALLLALLARRRGSDAARPTRTGRRLAFELPRAPRQRLALALALVALVVLAALGAAISLPGPRLQPPADYLTEKAVALGRDVGQIEAFVRDEVGTDPSYAGAFRGAVGTLWAGTGSDDDRALLLAGLLERASATTRFVTGSDGSVGVEVQGPAGWDWAGPAPQRPAGASVVEAFRADRFVGLAVDLLTWPASGPPLKERAIWRTADLAGQDLSMTYERVDGRLAGVVQGPGLRLVSAADAATATRQELEFHSLPLPGANYGGATLLSRSRELFATSDPGRPSTLDPSNAYTIVVTTGWVPASTAAREADIAKASADRRHGVAHEIAYSFLGLSDANTRELARLAGTAAAFVLPRVTIVGDEAGPADGDDRSVSLDLRANSIAVLPPAYGAALSEQLAWTRSLYDASIETSVLEHVTGRQSTSAADVMADLATVSHSQPETRTSLLTETMGRLGREPAGASIGVSVPGIDGISVRVDRAVGGFAVSAVGIQPALPARVSLGDEIAIAALAKAIDQGIVIAARIPVRHAITVSFTPGPSDPATWYDGARIVLYDGPEHQLAHEVQVLNLTGDRQFHFWSYLADDGTFSPEPRDSVVTIVAADVEGATQYTPSVDVGSDSTEGRIWRFLAKRTYDELVGQGFSTITYADADPTKLWVVDRTTVPVTFNGTQIAVPVLVLAGEEAARDAVRPPDQNGPDQLDSGGDVVNKMVVVDDAQFPFVLATTIARVPRVIAFRDFRGRVVDAVSGRPIDRASIGHETENAVSWPDGSWSLRSLDGLSTAMSFHVSAAGYVDRDLTRDVLGSGTAVAPIALDPAPGFGAAGLVEVSGPVPIDWSLYPTLQVGARERRLIESAIGGERDIVAEVPAAGPVTGWFEVDRATGEVYPRLSDGLYGSNTSGGLSGFSEVLRCTYEKAGSALGQLVSGVKSPGSARAAQDQAAALGNAVGEQAALPGWSGSGRLLDEARTGASTAALLADNEAASPAAPAGGSGCFNEAPEASPGGTGLPWWPFLLLLAVPPLVVAWRRRKPKDPCVEANARSSHAQQDAERLRARARQAIVAWQASRVAVARAHNELASLAGDESYVEGASGELAGVRLTRRALRLQRQAEQAIRDRLARKQIGEQQAQEELARWADPAYVQRLAAAASADAAQEEAKLRRELDEARASESRAREEADQAEAAAAAAELAARQAKIDAARVCSQEPETPGCNDDGFAERFKAIKEAFEDRQAELCREFDCGGSAIADFEGQYNTELAQALRALDAYILTYEALTPDLEDLWQAFRDMAGAMAVASYFDKVTEALLVIDGVFAAGTLAEMGISSMLARGVRGVSAGAEPALASEGAALVKALRSGEGGAGAAGTGVAKAGSTAGKAAAGKAAAGAVAGAEAVVPGAAKAAKIVVEEFEVAEIYLLGSADARALQFARQVKPMTGYTDVFIHGLRDGRFAIKKVGTTEYLTVEQLAARIRASGYQGGPIRLFSCHSGGSMSRGVLTKGAAEKLARLLKTNVLAPTDILWIGADGSYLVQGALKIRPKGTKKWLYKEPIGPDRPWAGYGCEGKPPRLLPI